MTVGRGVTTLMVVDVTDDGGLLTTPAGVVHDEPYKVAIWVKGTWTVIVTGASMVETEPPTERTDVMAVGTQVAVTLVLVLVAIHVVRVTVVTVGGAVVTI
jgi:hypothetical protein